MKSLVSFFSFLVISVFVHAQHNFDVVIPNIIMEGVESEISLVLSSDFDVTNHPEILIHGQPISDFELEGDKIKVLHTFTNESEFEVSVNNEIVKQDVAVIPLWLSVLPPLIAIILALLLKEVITSLFLGILSGTLIISMFSNGISGIIPGFLSTVDTYIMNALNSWEHIAVIVFSMSIAGVVSIISKNGGMRGVVNRLEPYAKNPRSGQFVIWLMGGTHLF